MIDADAIKVFDDVEKKTGVEKGILTMEMFEILCQRKRGLIAIANEKVKSYLLALGLAVQMKNEELFVPSLVCNTPLVSYSL